MSAQRPGCGANSARASGADVPWRSHARKSLTGHAVGTRRCHERIRGSMQPNGKEALRMLGQSSVRARQGARNGLPARLEGVWLCVRRDRDRSSELRVVRDRVRDERRMHRRRLHAPRVLVARDGGRRAGPRAGRRVCVLDGRKQHGVPRRDDRGKRADPRARARGAVGDRRQRGRHVLERGARRCHLRGAERRERAARADRHGDAAARRRSLRGCALVGRAIDQHDDRSSMVRFAH
jgi:hypothetical protein